MLSLSQEIGDSKGEGIKENVKKAIKDFDKAINLNPDIALFYYERGKAASHIDNFKDAISDYSKAIALKADTLEKLYALFKKTDEKIGLFEEIFGSYFGYYGYYVPDKYLSDFYERRGSAYENTGQIKKAIQDYEQSLIIYDNSPAAFSLISLYKEQKGLDKAVQFFSKLISLEPKKSSFYSYRAHVYFEMKQNDKAIKDYTKAIELAPELAYSYSERGKIYKEMKQYNKAIKDFTKAIELNLKYDVYGYYGAKDYSDRGRVYEEMKQYDKAKADFQKACDLAELFCNALKKFERDIAREDRWILYSSSENALFYYDKNGIRQLPNKHIRVWIRREEKYLPAYRLILLEYDCNNMEYTVSAAYDDEDNILPLPDSKGVIMLPVVPGSMEEKLSKIVCKSEKRIRIQEQ